MEKIFIRSGEMVVAEFPSEIVTILGSCVAVCLWDRKMKVGGMNHYLLPVSPDIGNPANGGLTATKILIESMINKVSHTRNLEARIFGGANQFFSNNFLMVGLQNIAAAKKVLAEARIPIITDETGGISGRKIYFNTQTGDVSVTLVNNVNQRYYRF